MKSEKGYPLASAFMTHQLLRTETVGLTVDGVPDIQYVCAIIESHLSRRRRLLNAPRRTPAHGLMIERFIAMHPFRESRAKSRLVRP